MANSWNLPKSPVVSRGLATHVIHISMIEKAMIRFSGNHLLPLVPAPLHVHGLPQANGRGVLPLSIAVPSNIALVAVVEIALRHNDLLTEESTSHQKISGRGELGQLRQIIDATFSLFVDRFTGKVAKAEIVTSMLVTHLAIAEEFLVPV